MKMTINVEDLSAIVQANRDQHSTLYEQALDEYRAQAERELQGYLDTLRAGRFVAVVWRLPAPEEHLDDYDRVLKILELTEDVTIVLDDAEVAMYVQNEWGWAKSWASNTVRYTSG